jgi:glucose uptake protein
MILPGSYTAALILLVLGMLGWGLWANLFKAAGGKWRFELFYFDFAVGVFLAALVIALTFGSLGFEGFSFRDDLQLAGKRQEVFAFAAGTIFNLGNMLLLAGVSVTGMTLAFPASLGCALIVSSLWGFTMTPGANVALQAVGMIAVVAAIIFDVMAFRGMADLRYKAQLKAQSESGVGKPRRRRSSAKGVGICLAGGLLLGSFMPLVQLASANENGLGPYSLGFLFSLGIVFSTFVFNLFFMNIPVHGKPVEITEYFRAKLSRHTLGVIGGVIWYAGLAPVLLRTRFEGAARVGAQVSYAIEASSVVIAALCGFLLWKEYEGADFAVKLRLGLMFVLLLAGIGALTAGVAVAR